jgi:hypothetical protein
LVNKTTFKLIFMKKYYLAFLIIHATASCFSQSEKDSILIKTHFQKKVMPGKGDISYLACWERRPYNTVWCRQVMVSI